MADAPDKTGDLAQTATLPAPAQGSDPAHTATLPARPDASDPAQTATVPARPGAVVASASAERAAEADIHSGAQDLAELPVIDPDTYVFGGYFARGGMGRIATVRDKRLGRVIAIKELIAKDPSYVARFRREIRITAQLQHPSIVSVLEAGQWASGEPFFAMKKVQGKSLKEAIEERKTLDERLGLIASTIAIVDALAYAHDRGVIHRDLKPANVLVGDFGETVVIDWGLAKDLRAGDDEPLAAASPGSGSVDSQMTAAGSIMGTPSFMAPEQARGDEADERSDVYALGAILYTVLTGKPPYHGGDAAMVMAQVLEEDPRPISDLEPGVPLDLQTIVARAMARDRAKRYPSAKELAADLKRFQTGQLVAAHRYTRGELLRRWLRKHRGAVVVASVAVLALAGLGAASFTRIVRERDRARVAEQDARARADALILAQARTSVATDPIGALTALRELSPASTHWSAARVVAGDAVAHGLPKRVLDDVRNELEVSPDGTLIAYARGPELRVRDVATGAERSLGKHGGDINDIEFSRDGKRIVSGSQDNAAGVWTLDAAPPQWLRGHSGYVTAVDFAVDDTAVITTGLDEKTRVWSLATGEARVIPAWLRSRQLSGDGQWIVAFEAKTGAAIWNVMTGKRALELGERCATFVPGTSDVVIADDKQVLIRSMTTGVETKLGDLTDRCTDLDVTREGRIVLATITGALLIGDTSKKEHTWIYRGITEPIDGIDVRADGSLIAAWGSRDKTVHLIDARTHTGQALAGSSGKAMFTSDGRIFAFDAKGRLLAWSTARGGANVFETNPSTRSLAVSRDGAFLVAGGRRKDVQVIALASGQATELTGMTSAVHHVAISPNGALIAALGEDHRARLFERASGKSVALPGRGQATLEFSLDGNHLAAIGDRDELVVWSVATGQVRSFDGHAKHAFAIAFSPRNDVLASGAGDGTVRIWNLATGAPRILGSNGAAIRALAFSPDGTQLAAVDEAGGVRVWPTAGGPARNLAGHTGWLVAVTFDPTGRWLATGGTDKVVRLWNLETGGGRNLGSHAEEVLELAFSPDGQTLASAAHDGTVQLWDLDTWSHRVLEGHTKWIWDIEWFADGTRLATVSHDGTARVWADDLPRDPKLLREWLADVTK